MRRTSARGRPNHFTAHPRSHPGCNMQRDMWVGIAWAGGLVVAMVSVFFHGLIVYAPTAFDVAWTDTEHEEVIEGERLDEGDSLVHTVAVPGTNVTRILVRLEWADDVGPANDEFSLSVEGPGDRSQAGSDDAGSIELRFDGADRPTIRTVEGANAEHALGQIERPNDAWEGDTEWTITVVLRAAPGSSGTADLGLDPQDDGANDYTLTVVWVTTDATLTQQP